MQRHLARLTLGERCAQMVFVRFRFDAPDYERVIRQVKKAGVGGVLLSGGTIYDVTPLVNSLQKVARVPLLMAAEYGDGAGAEVEGATAFPPNLAVGAAGSEELAQAKARATGLEARALGVPWVLAPVLDTHPLDPAADARSFGEDPAGAARLARAAVRGLHAAGALACAGPFPGAGEGEPPVLRPGIGRTPPFAAVAGEVDAVMTGHASVEATEPGTPACLSREVTEGLLRRDLGFVGIVVTDALAAPAVARFCPGAEAVERAALAGADVLLDPADAERAIAVLETAVKAGRVPEEAVDRAAEKILAVKERLGLFGQKITEMEGVERVVATEAHRAVARRIAEASVTLVRGAGRAGGSVSLLPMGGGLAVFEGELGRRLKVAGDAEVCVAALAGGPGPDEAVLARVREACRKHREVTVVSFGSPRILRHFPEAAGLVCAYGSDEHSQRAAARALAGEIPFSGRLPLSLGA